MYNYGLNTLRENQVVETDIQEEVKYNKQHCDPYRQLLEKQMEQTLKYTTKKKKVLDAKLQLIYARATGVPKKW